MISGGSRVVLTTSGGGADAVIDGEGMSRIFSVSGANSSLRLERMSLVNGYVHVDDFSSGSVASGGGIDARNGASIMLLMSSIINCTANATDTSGSGAYGGGAYLSDASIVLLNSSIIGCKAVSGGGLQANGQPAWRQMYGGAIYAERQAQHAFGDVTLMDSFIHRCQVNALNADVSAHHHTTRLR